MFQKPFADGMMGDLLEHRRAAVGRAGIVG
jgi:hypothetical protein